MKYISEAAPAAMSFLAINALQLRLVNAVERAKNSKLPYCREKETTVLKAFGLIDGRKKELSGGKSHEEKKQKLVVLAVVRAAPPEEGEEKPTLH